jgi:CBS domain-containing protein
MIVKDIMNTNVKTVEPVVTVQKAAQKMNRFSIGSLVVTKKKSMIGIVTERDLLKKIVAKAKDSSKIKVKQIMVKRVIMVNPETDVSDAADIMSQHKIKKLPVLHEDNLIGIITATDIVAAQPKMIEALSKLFSVGKKKNAVAG